jgi:NADPH2:quinone reductase
VLTWENVTEEKPGPGQVRLRQQAVGVNFIDIYHRNGYYAEKLPFTPGMEGAGVVVEVGEGVDTFKIGDRVAYAGELGSYAEERVVGIDMLVNLPDALSFEQGAAMMLQGLTAEVLLRRVFKVRAGDTILVHAAAGGTGLILCQWAAALGATVIGTVSTGAKADLARQNGCHHPVVTTDQDFVAEVLRITNGQKLPVVYDGVGNDTFLRSLDCLRIGGLMVSFGQASGAVEPIAPTLLTQKGSLFLTRPFVFHHLADRPALVAAAAALFDVVQSGAVKINIGRRHTLRDAAMAHEALQDRATTGAIVLTI